MFSNKCKEWHLLDDYGDFISLPADKLSVWAALCRLKFWCKISWRLHLWHTTRRHIWKREPQPPQSERKQDEFQERWSDCEMTNYNRHSALCKRNMFTNYSTNINICCIFWMHSNIAIWEVLDVLWCNKIAKWTNLVATGYCISTFLPRRPFSDVY